MAKKVVKEEEKKIQKQVLGIGIPYFKNTQACEDAFKEMMKKIAEQLQNQESTILCVYEDGQASDWLVEYQKQLGDKMFLIQNPVNYGVSHARNKILDEIEKRVLYVLFMDSDDDIADDYIKVMYQYCGDNSHDVIESGFLVNGVRGQYNHNVLRCGVVGSAIKTKIINGTRFNESLQIGEDTQFMKDVVDLTKHRKKFANTDYFYQLGRNDLSLTMRHGRKEIGKYR